MWIFIFSLNSSFPWLCPGEKLRHSAAEVICPKVGWIQQSSRVAGGSWKGCAESREPVQLLGSLGTAAVFTWRFWVCRGCRFDFLCMPVFHPRFKREFTQEPAKSRPGPQTRSDLLLSGRGREHPTCPLIIRGSNNLCAISAFLLFLSSLGYIGSPHGYR